MKTPGRILIWLWMLSQTGRLFAQDSIPILKSDLRNNPEDRVARYRLARLYLDQKDYSESLTLYKKLYASGGCTDAELKVYAVARMMDFATTVITWRTLSKAPIIDLFQQDMSHASKSLSGILERNPGDEEARFLLAMYHKIDGNKKRAEDLLRQVTESAPYLQSFFFEEPWIELASLLREEGRAEEATDLLKHRVGLDTSDTWPMIALAASMLEIHEDAAASSYFLRGLRNVRDGENLERLFDEASPIASVEEAGEWENLIRPADRANFLRRFWKERDPNPVDEANERWAAHYRRLAEARKLYPKIRPPYYDDRGFVYIRYGPPDRLYAGDRDLSWVYEKENAFFDFVDVGNGFYELRPLTDAIPGEVSQSSRLIYLHAMLDARRGLHPFYETTASRIESQINRLHAQSLPAQTTGQMANLAIQYEQSMNVRYANLNIKERFEFDTGVPDIKINADYVTFRSQAGSRLDFYFMVPLGQLNYIPLAKKDESSFLTVRMRLLDSLYNEIHYIEKSYEHTAPDYADTAGYFILDEFRSLTSPGRYLLALELKNNAGEKLGIYKIGVDVKDYGSQNLAISDVQSALLISDTGISDRFVKPDTRIRVVPNPAAFKVRNKPLNIYYEIYNLTLNNENKSAYEVSYKIEPEKSNFFTWLFSNQKGSVSISTKKSGTSVTEHEYSGFDISEFSPGRYVLKITVHDLYSGRSAERKTSLNIR